MDAEIGGEHESSTVLNWRMDSVLVWMVWGNSIPDSGHNRYRFSGGNKDDEVLVTPNA